MFECYAEFLGSIMRTFALFLGLLLPLGALPAGPFAGGLVVAQERRAAEIGRDVLKAGGTAVDAAVATAFALAVTHPVAGNLGGGGFMVVRDQDGKACTYDFREKAPVASHPEMFTQAGRYDEKRHHDSHVSVGVPGTVAGLYRAWQERGHLPWKRLVEPALRLSRDGITVSQALSDSLKEFEKELKPHPGTRKAFFKPDGRPYERGERLRQPELARTLGRIATLGADGFYRGTTARLLVAEMQRGGGLITQSDLASYRPRIREVLRGSYRGFELLAPPPPSSGGVGLIELLNLLEPYDLRASGRASTATAHLMTEAMRRAFADRARWLGDPDFVKDMPLERLASKGYAVELGKTIRKERASVSTPGSFEWSKESSETTHISVVDHHRNAVSMTYTLEDHYGSKIVVPGAGFLLNNEMGDFNAMPGLTDATGKIGTSPNLALPGKRMLSSMSPAILVKDGQLFMVTGSPGGRTIINTVLQTILNVVDFGLDAQAAVDARRFHHQWLPDQILMEPGALSLEVQKALEAKGHHLAFHKDRQGVAQVILVRKEGLEGGADPRWPESTAAGY